MSTATRECRKCGERRPETEFARDRSKPSGYKSSCKPCDRAKSAAYYAANRERELANDSERHKRTYHERGGREKRAETYAADRARAVEIYGGVCVGCGSQTGLEFDHVENNGTEHRRGENTAQMFRRIARSGSRLSDFPLRLLCFSCHRGPGVDSDAPRPTTNATAVARTLAALDLPDEFAAVACLAETYAMQIDSAHGDPGIVREIGPKLLDALKALGATPATGATKAPPAAAPRSKLDRFSA